MRTAFIISIAFFLAACGASAVEPQVTATSQVIVTLTPATTPTASVTPTPALPPELGLDPAKYKMDGDKIVSIEDGEVAANLVDGKWISIEVEEVVATPELINFPVVKIENFHDNPMTYEQGVSGSIDAWLNTLSQPFDPAVINDVPLRNYGGEIMYDTNTAPNFKVKGSEPFHRDIASGELFFEKDGVTYNYIFLPVEYYDKNTKQSYWVKMVSPIYPIGNLTQREREAYDLPIWRESMRIVPILDNARVDNMYEIDPLAAETFKKYPDMAERMAKFVSGEDMSLLSEPDMFFLTYIGTDDLGWYK